MATDRIDQLLAFLAEDKEDPFVRFALATEYLKIGDESTALLWFEKLVDEQPGYIGTYYHLGKLYLRLDRIGDATRTFDRGIEVASEAKDFHAVSELQSARMDIDVES